MMNVFAGLSSGHSESTLFGFVMNNTLFVNVSFCVLGVTMTETSALVEISYALKSFSIQTAKVDCL